MGKLFQVCGCDSKTENTFPLPPLFPSESGTACIQEIACTFILHFGIGVFLSPQATAKSSRVKLAVPSVADTAILSCVEMSFEPIQFIFLSGGTGSKHGCRVALLPHKMLQQLTTAFHSGRRVLWVKSNLRHVVLGSPIVLRFFRLVSTLKNQISCKKWISCLPLNNQEIW